MKQFLTLVFILLAVSMLSTSCSSASGKRLPVTERDVYFRAHHTWFSDVTFNRVVDNATQIIRADSAYRPGDTIMLNSREYILLEKVR